MSLLTNWSPVTYDFGLVHASTNLVARHYVAWQQRLHPNTICQEFSSFAAGLEALPPLSVEKRRTLLVPTASEWTAFFQSGIDGSDPSPAMGVLAREILVETMRIVATPPRAKWPATIWEVYAPSDRGGQPPLFYRRTIAASNDGGRWRFEQTGTPFSFEHSARYQAPRKRDRFTPEHLAEYLACFGLKPFSDDFYVASEQCPAVLVERPPWSASPAQEYSLEEVRRGLPWEKG